MTSEEISVDLTGSQRVIRRRATVYGRPETIAARKLVSQTQRKLETWQAKAAMLRAAVGARKTDVGEVRSEAAKLVPLVIAERIELEGLIDTAEDKVRNHSVIRDVAKALDHLRLQLEDVADRANSAAYRDEP